MKNIKLALLLFLFTILVSLNQSSVFAETDAKELPFVELSFKINSTTYQTKGVTKAMDVPPFIENESTLVPFRVIFEELGYEIEWSDADSSITAKQGNNTMWLQINNKFAKVNGVQKEMSIAPKIVDGRTVMPLRFVSENAGAEVTWDGALKTITITRTGKFDTGTIMFYEQASGKNSSIVHVYNGVETKSVKLEDKNLVNWYSFKGKVLATLIDKKSRKNNFVIYKDENFETLIDDFDIQDTFEYNDNLLIHGYDRDQKINKLYRFDGKQLTQIESDFYVGKHILVKDRLIVNKYNSKRDYTLLEFNKKSWKPRVLQDNFIIQDSMEYDGILYINGRWEEGSEHPLVSYEVTEDQANFVILLKSIDIDFAKTIVYKKELYTIMSGGLNTLTKEGLKPVYFLGPDGLFNLTYSVKDFKYCNDKLYIVAASEKKYDLSKDRQISSNNVNKLIEFDETRVPRVVIDEFVITKLIVEGDKILMLGAQTNGDKAMNIYNGESLVRALDVVQIKKVIAVKDKLFIDVVDINRINLQQRDGILVYFKDKVKENDEVVEKYVINNVVMGMKSKNWAKVGDALVFWGLETDINKDKLYSYTSKFNVETEDYNISFWTPEPEKLFVGGYNKIEKAVNLFRFANGSKKLISDSISIEKMIKVKGNYYLVYGAFSSATENPLNGKNILYIYSDTSNKFFEMKTGITITDMLFVK